MTRSAALANLNGQLMPLEEARDSYDALWLSLLEVTAKA